VGGDAIYTMCRSDVQLVLVSRMLTTECIKTFEAESKRQQMKFGNLGVDDPILQLC
jgi:hypothetical protein